MYPKDNPESWSRISQGINEYPDDQIWRSWKLIAHDTVNALQSHGLAELFRIGQSMHHIVISTKSEHRLTGEPSVTLAIDAKRSTIRVAYGTGNLWFDEPLVETTCQIGDAVPAILTYLARLWRETKPEIELPRQIAAFEKP